jgi:hypothetical protein
LPLPSGRLFAILLPALAPLRLAERGKQFFIPRSALYFVPLVLFAIFAMPYTVSNVNQNYPNVAQSIELKC